MRRTALYVMLILILTIFLCGCGPKDVNAGVQAEDSDGRTGNNFRQGMGSTMVISQSEEHIILEEEAFTEGEIAIVMAAVTFDQEDRIVTAVLNIDQRKIYIDSQGMIATDRAAEVLRQEELQKIDKMINSGEVNPCGVNWNTAEDSTNFQPFTVDEAQLREVKEFENWILGKTMNEIKALLEDGDDPIGKQGSGFLSFTQEDYINAIVNAHQKVSN